MAQLLPLADVNSKTVFPGTLVPDLGLRGAPEDEIAVYVLQSGDKYYVGAVERCYLKVRLAKHAEGRGAYWNKVNVPDGVVYVMPVPHRAAEAYVFYALLAKLPAKSLQRLGGWTQTSVNPSPPARLLAQEARRNVHGLCFACGSGDHFQFECSKPPEAAPYPCKQCGAVLKVTCRGHTPGESTAATPQEKRKADEAIAPQAAHALEHEARRNRVCRSSVCLRVRVCGTAYTTLGWFLGDSCPNRHQRQKAMDKCMAKAVEMHGGDSKTLQAQMFTAAYPKWGKELLPGRTNLPHDWVDSACASVRAVKSRGKDGAASVQLRKATTGGVSQCRGLLWRVEDLAREIGD